MSNNIDWIRKPEEVAERCLIGVASKLQLTPTLHDESTQRYETLCKKVDEGDHELSGKVLNFYPSGSFAIGAVIRGKVSTDQHDVDIVVELDLPVDSNPEYVLTALYEAVRGSPGSMYYNLTTLQSRCVTVTYADNRTVDIMPAVMIQEVPRRVIQIFHWKEDTGESYHKLVCPKGFAEHYLEQLPQVQIFSEHFNDRMVALAKAETAPMPDYEALPQKSPRQIALQLLKRKRNMSWRNEERKRLYRKPPSIIIAEKSIQQTRAHLTLIDETIAMAEFIYNRIMEADRAGETLYSQNPAWPDDVFSDRWPEDRANQRVFAEDLKELSDDLKRLRDNLLEPTEVLKILKKHFGEQPAQFAFKEFANALGEARRSGRTKVSQYGGVTLLSSSAPAVTKRTPDGGAFGCR